MSQPDEPGFYYGVPFEDYREWPAINISLLKEMDKTPAHAFYRKQHAMEATDEMRVGSATHCRILEPGKWDSRFYVCPPCKLNTKEGKTVYADAVAMANARTVIRLSEDDETASAIQMAEAIRGHELCRDLISNPGQCEVSVLWYDDLAKQWCKGRFDKLITDGEQPIILEIKTSSRIGDFHFARTAKNLHYDAQAAWYLWGYSSITWKTAIHMVIAIESKEPFCCRVLKMNDESLETGFQNYSRWYQEYCRCLKTDSWPGYPSKVQTLILPQYGEDLELTIGGKAHAL